MEFDYTITTTKATEQVVEALKAALKEQGFGVLGILDFQNLLRERGVELGREYKLLEVCNPLAAKQVLDKDPRIGLVLPCTIAVYRHEGATKVSLLKPSSLLNLIPAARLGDLAAEAEARLRAAVDRVR